MNGPRLVRAKPSDLEFIRRCHREAMKPHIERAFGAYDEAEQRRRFDRSTDPASHDLVVADGSRVGCLWVREHEDHLELVRLYLLAESQGRGIGSAIVRDLIERARDRGTPLRLRVLKVNRSVFLYERLGFRIDSETETHFRMVWTGASVPRSLELPGLSLRPLSRADAPELLAHLRDPEVCRYLDIDPLETIGGALAIVHWADGIRNEGSGVRYAIRDTGSGDLCGTAGLHQVVSFGSSRGELGYDLAQRYWGRGVMARVLPALVQLGFETLDLARLQALVTPGNQRSRALLLRHGFQLEGVLRAFGRWRGGLFDQEIYARLRSEA